MTRTTTQLDVLLHDALAFAAGTRNGLSNHLPMELVALDALGAEPSHLRSVYDAYARDWSSPRDDGDRVEALRDEVFADGIEAVVRRRLPALADGPASEWFHSMIRLAYAVEARHDGQVAAALLDWERHLRALTPAPPATGPRAVAGVLASLPPVTPGWDLGAAARTPGVAEAMAGVDPSLDALAALAVAAHVASGPGDFATLHHVTGTHAARVVAPLLDAGTARRLALRTTEAVLVGLAAAGARPAPEEQLDRLRERAPGWDGVVGRASTADGHVAKLVHTCRSEERATGDPLYRWVAARAVGQVTGSGG